MDTDLRNKIIVVTGAADGIGRATAIRLAAEGARLMLADIDAEKLARTAGELRKNEVEHLAIDVSEPSGNKDLVKAAMARFGRIDGAVLNVGIFGEMGTITGTDVATFDKVIAVNVRGTWLGLKYLIPAIAEQGRGAIVLTGSTAGFRAGAPGRAPYVASKHAVIGLMRAAAAECAPLGIRVNAVSPGGVMTGMSLAFKDMVGEEKAQQMLEAFESTVPMKRLGQPEEIADAIVFLLGDASRYYTATNLMVDGGLMG